MGAQGKEKFYRIRKEDREKSNRNGVRGRNNTFIERENAKLGVLAEIRLGTLVEEELAAMPEHTLAPFLSDNPKTFLRAYSMSSRFNTTWGLLQRSNEHTYSEEEAKRYLTGRLFTDMGQDWEQFLHTN